ncbi:MAG: hypothetical protein HKM05_05685 [Spirochaetales bacterium]|nr:hypothetical protein [Spirochaetales bacterium]
MSFRVVLVEPEIPQNTGCELPLVRPLGFPVKANAVAIVVYEGFRQIGYLGLS